MQVNPLLKEISEMNEITFWSRQMAEHGLFVSIELQAGKQVLDSLGLGSLINDGLSIYDFWMDLFNRDMKGEYIDQQVYRDGVIISKNYLKTVLEVANKVWIGYSLPSELEHYLDETNYYEKIINGEMITQKELEDFWLDALKDHAALFAHLLDPKEDLAIDDAYLFKQLFAKMPANLYRAVNDFNSFTLTLREEQSIGKLRSIIPPRLALHIYREGLEAKIKLGLL